MKLRFLGTAAAEGFPAVFCNCEYCREARRLGGKNIRTRSQSLINGDLLIDLPADTYHHFLMNNIEGDRIKYLLITHFHQDHLYANELRMRGGAFSHDMREETLTAIAGGKAYEDLSSGSYRQTEIVEIKPFETVALCEYEITAIPARHAGNTGAVNYIIKGDKTLLYAHDTGFPFDESLEFIKERGFVFDLVSLDCTNVDIPIPDTGSHMGIPNNLRLADTLRAMGAVRDDTTFVINHFSHNGNPLYDTLSERVKDYGFLVSYDGMCVEI